MPWRDVPMANDKRERGHGRRKHRTLKVTVVASGLAFPHAAQTIQIVRRRNVKGNSRAKPATRSPAGPAAGPDPHASQPSRQPGTPPPPHNCETPGADAPLHSGAEY